MKTFTLTVFLLFFATLGVSAQSQRLVLLEYFTQASCGPCATYNPGINAMLAANPNTVIALKYQTSWPGVDPMNAHNPTEVANRVTYYGVSGVPNGVIDGNYYNGHPNGINLSAINARATAPSPFDITVNHTLSAGLDSIHITATITATQNIAQPLTARIAVIEKEIHFNMPPGNNGEKSFYSVMKKLLPGVNGTTLPATMNSGDEITINESWKLANVYDLNQLAVVAFVQNTSSKEVHQSALSAPQPIAMDISARSVEIPFTHCSNVVDADVVVKNLGATTITTIDLLYTVNGGSPVTYPWTGSISTGVTETITIPGITLTGSSGTLNNIAITVENPNGDVDLQPGNNSANTSFHVISNYAPLPLYEGFVATTFPPTDWLRNNPDNGATWTRIGNAGGFGYSNNSTRMNFYNSAEGNVDELYLKPLNFQWTTSPDLYLLFHMAYAQFNSTYIDTLRILVSTDCGDTWTNVFTQYGAAMATAPANQNSFTPNASQWRAESINMSQFIGESEVLVKFTAISGYGNNLFIDDINISESAVSINELGNPVTEFSVYPNPVKEQGIITFNLAEGKNINIDIYNVLGEKVVSVLNEKMSAGKHTLAFNSTGLDAGIYFLNMTSEEGVMTRKVTIVK